MSIKTFMNESIWSASLGYNTIVVPDNNNKVKVVKNPAANKALKIAGYIPGVALISGVARVAISGVALGLKGLKSSLLQNKKDVGKRCLTNCIRGVAEMAQLGLVLLIVDIAADKLRAKPQNG